MAAGYLRLSKEDGDDESSSITNQRKIIQAFAKANGLTIDEFYIDDGYSGYTMNRPDFNRLKADLNRGKVDTIIVKDFSRLSRNSGQSQIFLENILESGKRVITIQEGYDTFNPKTHDMAGIYAWMNEKYIRDTSQKVRSSIDSMQKEGKYISSVPYGYVKDPNLKDSYRIDESCAIYVRRMFDMYINGMGCKAIAKQFTVEGVPTWRMLEKRRLENLGRTFNGKINTRWSGEVIQRMIQNQFYAGDLVLNKTTRRSINGKAIPVPKEEWYVFENAHEAIIDRETFNLAQELYEKRNTERYRGVKNRIRPNIFSGVLYCADCGERMTSSSNNLNTRYVCRTYNKYGTDFCQNHAVLEGYIKECLLNYLDSCRDRLVEVAKNIDLIIRKESGKEDVLDQLEKDLARVKQELKLLMEQRLRDTMSNPAMAESLDEMYKGYIQEKLDTIKSIEKQLADNINLASKEQEVKSNVNSVIDLFNEILDNNDLNKKQVLTLVEKIIVHEDGGLDLILKGDLHELCSNQVNIKEDITISLDKFATEYILSNKTFLTPTGAWKYAVANGVKIGFIRYSKYFQKFIDNNYVTKLVDKKVGYEFTSTDKALKTYTQYNNVTYIATWQVANDVTIELVMAISEYGSTLYKGKSLF